jgi:hypothetical protein
MDFSRFYRIFWRRHPQKESRGLTNARISDLYIKAITREPLLTIGKQQFSLERINQLAFIKN